MPLSAQCALAHRGHIQPEVLVESEYVPAKHGQGSGRFGVVGKDVGIGILGEGWAGGELKVG